MKLKLTLLLCLMSVAAFCVGGAWRSLNRSQAAALPEEVAARFVGREDSAAYFLRDSSGYVAVYGGRRERTPLVVTKIETAALRGTDRLLLQKGIPVSDGGELLLLLEDLGS
ncbi:MAG: hypothetical protein IJV41_04360 [Oscillospiraceae bacterium]|nr:hypothetical protein [Oscillospiraceae bacterium]